MAQSTIKERLARVEVTVDNLNNRVKEIDGKVDEVLKIIRNGMNVRLVKLEQFVEDYNNEKDEKKDWWKWAVRGATLTVYGYFIKTVVENFFK